MKKLILLTTMFLLSTAAAFAQTFNYIKKITPPNTDSARVASDAFGSSVDISGNYAIVGAQNQDWDSAGTNYKSNAGAAYIWERSTSTSVWGMRKKLSPRGSGGADSARVAVDNLGFSVGISGDICIAGAYGYDYDSTGANVLTGAGAAFIWERNSVGAWTQVKRITAPDRQSSDQFAIRVAIDVNTVVVGAVSQDRDSAIGNFKSNAGAAYVYERVNGVWGFAKKLSPPNTDSARVAGDNFGTAVAISGNYIAVGANGQDWDSVGGRYKANAGAVYVFERRNGVWGYAKKLTPPNTDSARVADDRFGAYLAIDGTTIVVGAAGNAGAGQDWDSAGGNYKSAAGAAYIFERNNGQWGYTKKITPPNTDSARVAGDIFGFNVSISGNYIVIGALTQGFDSVGGSYKSSAGAAYVWEKRNGVWGYSKKLTPPNTDSARLLGDRFGGVVAIGGNYAIISSGTTGNSTDYDSAGGNYKGNTGAAYIFEYKDYNLRYNNGWTGGLSPNSVSGVYNCFVEAGTATIAASSAIRSLTVNSGTTASLSGDLSISGNYTNIGTVSGVGKIVLNGGAAQNIYGNGTTGNLQLNNSLGATIQDSLGINGILNLTSGTLTTNGKLKLEATGATTYGQIAGTGAGTLSGTLTSEFLITGGGGNWRPLCSPVSGATLAQINDDVVLNFGTPESSYATVRYFNEQTSPYWPVASSTSDAFGDSAYSIYLGGTATWASPLPLMLDIEGNYRGTSDYTHANLTRTGSLADSTGWNYVANPWPSGFMWDNANITVNSGGIQGDQIWVYNQSAGAYQVFDGTDNGVVPPFTPLLFEVTSNNTSITLKNSARTTDSLLNYFDKTSLPNFVQVQVSDTKGKTDKVKFYTDDNATNGYDIMDGNKRINIEAPNLYFVLAGKKANKEVWNTLPGKDEPVQLNFEANNAGQYTFNFVTENLQPNIAVELTDLKSGAKHDVSQGTFIFAHDLTNHANRFEINFVKKSGVGVEETEVSPLYIGSTGNNVTIVTPQAGSYTVEVHDLLGRTIQAPVTFNNAANQAQTITVYNISAGYYLVKVSGQQACKTTKVFLK